MGKHDAQIVWKVGKALKLRQSQLAEVLGVSKSSIRQYQGGFRKFPTSRAADLISLCISRGRTDLADEIKRELITQVKPALNKDTLHALLDEVIAEGNAQTLETVSSVIQMALYWRHSAGAHDVKILADRLNGVGTMLDPEALP